MSKKKIPGSREEDSWFSEEQLEQLQSAEDDRRGLPIPTQMVSNGEYMPNQAAARPEEPRRFIFPLTAGSDKGSYVSYRPKHISITQSIC